MAMIGHENNAVSKVNHVIYATTATTFFSNRIHALYKNEEIKPSLDTKLCSTSYRFVKSPRGIENKFFTPKAGFGEQTLD